MDTKIDFLYLSEPDMIKAGVKDMKACVESMEKMLLLLKAGDYRMGGENGNSHGCMIMFPDHPKFPGMPRNTQDRRFMAMPAYLGGDYQMAGVKWYGSNIENKEKGLPRSILMMTLSDKDTGAPLAFMSANRRCTWCRCEVSCPSGFRNRGYYWSRCDGENKLSSFCSDLSKVTSTSY